MLAMPEKVMRPKRSPGMRPISSRLHQMAYSKRLWLFISRTFMLFETSIKKRIDRLNSRRFSIMRPPCGRSKHKPITTNASIKSTCLRKRFLLDKPACFSKSRPLTFRIVFNLWRRHKLPRMSTKRKSPRPISKAVK